MCIVSAVGDYGFNKPPDYWTPERLRDFQRTIEVAQEFDEKHDEPHCEKDYLVEWLKDLEARVRELEAGE